MIRRRIQILALQPEKHHPGHLSRHVREIQQGMQRAAQRQRFSVAPPRWVIDQQDFHQALLDGSPHVVHMLSAGSVSLKSNRGRLRPLLPLQMEETLVLTGQNLACVVLNGPNTAAQAEVLARRLPYVIGFEGSLDAAADLAFVTGFYDAVGAGRSFEEAFLLARSLLRSFPGDAYAVPRQFLGGGSDRRTESVAFERLQTLTQAQIQQMMADYKNQLREHADDEWSHYCVGHCYLQLGNPSLAVKHYREARCLDAGFAEAYYYEALATLSGKRLRILYQETVMEAIVQCETAVGLNHQLAHFYYFLAAVKYDYFEARHFRVTGPNVKTCLFQASKAEHQSGELLRLKSHLKLSDPRLLEALMNANV